MISYFHFFLEKRVDGVKDCFKTFILEHVSEINIRLKESSTRFQIKILDFVR